MTDKKRPSRDIWKTPPRGNEGDAAKEFEPPAEGPADKETESLVPEAADSPALDRTGEEEAPEETADEAGYSPRHRAPGRAPLIRRKRNRIGDEEEVSWETTWSEEPRSSEPSRWTTEEEPSVTPPPKPMEDLPYLGPRRSEQRRRRPRPGDETPTEIVRRSRDYTGRHLAPKKPARWARDEESGSPPPPPPLGNYVEFQDRARVEATPPRREALVEGDVDDTDRRAETPAAERPAAEETAAEAAAPETPVAQQAEAEAHGPQAEEAAVDERPGEPSLTAAAEPEPKPQPEARAAVPVAARPSEPKSAEPTSEPPEQRSETEIEQVGPVVTRAAAEAEAVSETETQPVEPSRPQPPPAPESVVAPPGLTPSEPETDVPPEEADDEFDSEVVVLDEEEGDEAPPGPRRAALQERKKKQRLRQTIGTVAAIVAAAVAIGAAGVLVKNVVDPPPKVAVPVNQPAPGARLGGTTLLFGTKESSDDGRGAIWMTLFSYDPETEEASVVYIPPHTAVEVPGRGLQGVGEAYGSGGVPLLLVSAENLLGVNIDRYVELSDKDALVLFEELDTLTVDVPAEVRVPAGRDEARLIFVEGPQELTPQLLVKLLYIVGIDGDDVELGGRHLAFWQQLLEVHDADEIASAVEAAGPALGESDASVRDLAEFFGAVAELPAEDVVLTALPVRPISAGESELYSADAEELAAFVEDTIGVNTNAPQEVRVQLLNGNGVPGLGREVADLLVGKGFRVILGGNAQRLNYRRTLVIAYDSSDEAIATAERARELLGVGEVQVSAQQQGIVDLTIVVGKDFLRAH